MLLLALLLVSASPETVATKLDRAQAKASALELDEAREVLLDVVTDARATNEELRRAHLLAGEVDRILGKDVDARMHFIWVLQRDPNTQLPPDKPPKITAFFELVRAEVKGAPPAAAAAPAAAPAAAAAPPPAAAVPAPARDEGLSLPLIIASAGGIGALTGITIAVVGENGFATVDAPWSDRESAQYLALTGWTIAGAGAIVAGAGLVMMDAADDAAEAAATP